MKKHELYKKFIKSVLVEDYASAKATLQGIIDNKIQQKISEAYKNLKETK